KKHNAFLKLNIQLQIVISRSVQISRTHHHLLVQYVFTDKCKFCFFMKLIRHPGIKHSISSFVFLTELGKCRKRINIFEQTTFQLGKISFKYTVNIFHETDVLNAYAKSDFFFKEERLNVEFECMNISVF